jgi:hypothetical protein
MAAGSEAHMAAGSEAGSNNAHSELIFAVAFQIDRRLRVGESR